jgi:aminocarboxymuconate-semialdehyde decarboxylase
MVHCASCLQATLLFRNLLDSGGLAAALFALMGVAPATAGKRGARQPRAIDVHAHFFPEGFLKSLAEEGGPPAFPVDLSDPMRPTVARGGFRLVLDPSYWDLRRRLERMDGQGVELQALSLTAPMVHWAPPERGARLARTVNDAMSAAHTAHPDRFVGCAVLPLQDPALALQELNRVVGDRAFRGAYFPTNVNGKELSDPALFPIYELCQERGLPVLLHPVAVIGAERLQPYYLNNLLGNPFDTTVAAANLVFGGVLDRFPRLEVVLPHAGGALPMLWARLQRGQRVRPEAKDRAQHPFHDYLRRFHYDTIGHDPQVVRYLVDVVGSDRVMLGSDYCFDMGYEQPREIIGQLKLSAKEQKLILGGNAARLLGV